METNRTGRSNVFRTAGAVAAAMQVNRHLSIPIATTALALALAACGATGTAENAAAKGTTQGGVSASAEHTDDISVGVKPDENAVKLLPAAVKAKGKLSVAMDLSYPPTTFMASDNKTPIGFNPDMSRLIAAKLGLKLQINNVKFDTIITGLQADRYDFTASTMGATSDRLKVLDMVDYVNSGTGVSVPYGNPQKLGTHTLCGHRVAVPSGSTAELQWLPQLSEQDCTSKGKLAHQAGVPAQRERRSDPAGLQADRRGDVRLHLARVGGRAAAQDVRRPQAPGGHQARDRRAEEGLAADPRGEGRPPVDHRRPQVHPGAGALGSQGPRNQDRGHGRPAGLTCPRI